MATILNSREEIAKLDVKNGLASIEQVGSQVKQTWDDTASLVFPDQYRRVKSIVVAGMGGSAYGTHVLSTLFKDELTVPVLSIPDYTLPSWVNEETLVILSSYSGSTEETLSAAADAKAKGAQITGLTTGGKLAEFLNEGNYPSYIFKPTYNPCNTPRYALGYSVFGQMVLLARIGLLKITKEMVDDVLAVIADVQLRANVAVGEEANIAKLLAFEVAERIPVIVAAEHLEGAAHVVANAFNETAKTYSEYRIVPELNHHLMEGLQFPHANESTLLFSMVGSKLYGKQNQKRMQLTAQVIEKNHCEYRELTLTATTKIGQAFELMVVGAYAAFYTAMLYGQDPVPNVWVDWFKSELKK